MGAVSQGTPLGDRLSASEIESLRNQGKVALPEDLGIDRSRANKDLLAAKTLDEIAEISGGLYEVPASFKK